MDGRGAIGLALAYIGTQQPFPYVHLLSILTDLALAVNAMYVGLHTGRQLFGVQPHCDVAQAAALQCASSWQSESRLNVRLYHCCIALTTGCSHAATLRHRGGKHVQGRLQPNLVQAARPCLPGAGR